MPLADLVGYLTGHLSKLTLDQLSIVLPAIDRLDVEAPPVGASWDDVGQLALTLPGRHKLRDVERAVIAHALAISNGNVSAAARLLGVQRKALERKIRRHRLVLD